MKKETYNNLENLYYEMIDFLDEEPLSALSWNLLSNIKKRIGYLLEDDNKTFNETLSLKDEYNNLL